MKEKKLENTQAVFESIVNEAEKYEYPAIDWLKQQMKLLISATLMDTRNGMSRSQADCAEAMSLPPFRGKPQ